MNEVTKLYENAGVEKHYCSFESCDGNVYNWELNEDGEEKYNKCFLGKPKIKQRLFTAEKQLELIKWLCQNTYRNYIHIRYERDINNWKIECNMIGIREFGNFDECFAGLINNLWQDLTEEERKQIKNILESEVRE